jgi:hypothetical protein
MAAQSRIQVVQLTDIVLLAPSWRGLQCLLDLLTNHASKIYMVINTSKSVCMVFFPHVFYSKRFVCAYMILHYGLNTQLGSSISFGHVVINASKFVLDIGEFK